MRVGNGVLLGAWLVVAALCQAGNPDPILPQPTVPLFEVWEAIPAWVIWTAFVLAGFTALYLVYINWWRPRREQRRHSPPPKPEPAWKARAFPQTTEVHDHALE